MGYLVAICGLAVVIAALCGIAKLASGDRYSKVTEEEFEAEAKRSSALSGSMAELQKIFDPSHRVEYVEEQQNRAEADDAESSDGPETDPTPPRGDPVKR